MLRLRCIDHESVKSGSLIGKRRHAVSKNLSVGRCLSPLRNVWSGIIIGFRRRQVGARLIGPEMRRDSRNRASLGHGLIMSVVREFM
jgi:hypothetical protein